jgi:hypothetical protein
MSDMSGYQDDLYLIEHLDFYNAMVDAELWKERDFSKVPTRAVCALWDEYNDLPTGTPRKEFRLNNPSLEAWLVQVKGYKAVSDEWESIPREEVFAMP